MFVQSEPTSQVWCSIGQTVKNITATVKTAGIVVTKFGRSQAGLMAAAA